jgi:hypothetical protein
MLPLQSSSNQDGPTTALRAVEWRKIEMSFDPDEDVTLNGAKMTLRSAVAKVMALPPDDRIGVTIFRNGDPSILDRAQIEDIADLQGFQGSWVQHGSTGAAIVAIAPPNELAKSPQSICSVKKLMAGAYVTGHPGSSRCIRVPAWGSACHAHGSSNFLGPLIMVGGINLGGGLVGFGPITVRR